MSNPDQPAVIVKDLYKTFKLPHEQHSGIKQAAVSIFRGKKGYETQKVLNDISFEINKGEFFGIVGRNGSGKSTLLKLLAGIYVPDSGLVQVNGNLTPFIELGVGFNPELTGQENVFLNGALLGFSRAEMQEMYDEIVQFAELEKFMDQKLKNYSSGMQVRLAFSIAIRANTPILLIDEVLAVGDSEFQSKCYAAFRKLKEEGRTIIFVTHDMSAVERFCDRVLVVKSGKAVGVFSPQEASVMYESMNIPSANSSDLNSFERWGTHEVVIAGIELFDAKSSKPVTTLVQGHDVRLQLNLKNNNQEKDIVVGLAFYDAFGVNISGPNSRLSKLKSTDKVSFSIPRLSLVPGDYTLTTVIFDEHAEKEYDHIKDAVRFSVIGDATNQHGKINLFGEWR